MRNFLIIALVAALLMIFTSCGSSDTVAYDDSYDSSASPTSADIAAKTETFKESSVFSKTSEINKDFIDLTVLSSTMVYSEIYNMINQPEDYMGKTVKIRGDYAVFKGEGRNYYSCIVKDATACCSQGLELLLKDKNNYPEFDPEKPVEIEVTGNFNAYLEDEQVFLQLEDAEYTFV